MACHHIQKKKKEKRKDNPYYGFQALYDLNTFPAPFFTSFQSPTLTPSLF